MSMIVLDGEQGDIESCLTYVQGLGIDKQARLLDIGCRHGSLLANLRQLGHTDLVGVDISADAVERGRAAYPDLADRLHVYDGGALPLPPHSVDVVTMFDVIEHIPDPERYLRGVRQVLKPDGLFIFQTPNILVDVPYWILALRLFNREKLAWLFREHCSLQTYHGLRRLLRRAGFRDVRVEKNRSDTAFKMRYVEKTLGRPGVLILKASEHFPMILYPNFWGSARA